MTTAGTILSNGELIKTVDELKNWGTKGKLFYNRNPFTPMSGGVNSNLVLKQNTSTYTSEYISRNFKGAAIEPVAAVKTLTLSTVVADDTFTLAGIAFTYKATSTSETEIALGADDTAAAANTATKINNHSTVGLLVSATSATNVVTITSLKAGTDFTLSESETTLTTATTTANVVGDYATNKLILKTFGDDPLPGTIVVDSLLVPLLTKDENEVISYTLTETVRELGVGTRVKDGDTIATVVARIKANWGTLLAGDNIDSADGFLFGIYDKDEQDVITASLVNYLGDVVNTAFTISTTNVTGDSLTCTLGVAGTKGNKQKRVTRTLPSPISPLLTPNSLGDITAPGWERAAYYEGLDFSTKADKIKKTVNDLDSELTKSGIVKPAGKFSLVNDRDALIQAAIGNSTVSYDDVNQILSYGSKSGSQVDKGIALAFVYPRQNGGYGVLILCKCITANSGAKPDQTQFTSVEYDLDPNPVIFGSSSVTAISYEAFPAF